MNKLYYFYATRGDLLSIIEAFEAAGKVQYFRFGQTTKLPPESFTSAAQIPNLGIASHSSAVGCRKFVVCDTQTAIKPRQLKTLSQEDVDLSDCPNEPSQKALIGVERFAIDQLFNQDTITFSPGGMWNEEILLHAAIGTASNSQMSLALMNRFKMAIKKSCIKMRSFYVGPLALELLKNGTRLTISAQSPREFDLTIK